MVKPLMWAMTVVEKFDYYHYEKAARMVKLLIGVCLKGVPHVAALAGYAVVASSGEKVDAGERDEYEE